MSSKRSSQNSCGHSIITDGCKSCKYIEDIWYKKLRKTFNDAENSKYLERPLRVWHKDVFKNVSLDQIQAIQDYYAKALDLLYSFKFENYTIKRIWELHCQGLSRYKIALEIKNLKLSYKTSQIGNFIKMLEREMLDMEKDQE